jgi:hypothetical protein
MKNYRVIVLAISAAFLITGCGESTTAAAAATTTPAATPAATQALNTAPSNANLVN